MKIGTVVEEGGISVVHTNWGGNYEFRARRIVTPTTVDEVRDLIMQARAVRAVGTRHSFNDLADADDLLISTTQLPVPFRVNENGNTVTVGAGIRYGDLARQLDAASLALPNLASLPHISLSGAVSTATHGSGDTLGNLATAVSGLRMVSGSGELVELSRNDRDFAGAIVALGALGVVTEVTLDVEPTFDVRQRVFTGLDWSEITEHFDQITGAAYNVSLFTTWDEPAVSQVWLKERRGQEYSAETDFFGAQPATVQQHMIRGMDVRNTTEQLGVFGPWHERLAHFRFDFTPSNGAEIQSEYLLPRSNAVHAIGAMRDLAPRFAPLLYISEIRTVRSDTLWLSTAYEMDAVALHFTWHQYQDAVEAVLPDIEAALFPLGARPHWGKLFLDKDRVVPGLYPRLNDFAALTKKYDPEGRFRNFFMNRLLE